MGDSQQLQSIQQIGAPYLKDSTTLRRPVQLDFGLRIHNTGGIISATTEGYGNSRNLDNLFDIVIDTSLNRIKMIAKKPMFDVVDGITAGQHPFHKTIRVIPDATDGGNIYLYFDGTGVEHSPALPSGLSNVSGVQPFSFIVEGIICHQSGTAKATSDISSGTTMFTLPVWLRPAQTISTPVNVEKTGTIGKFDIASNGVVKYYGSTIPSGTRIDLMASYRLKDERISLEAIPDNWLGWISVKGSNKFNMMV